MRVLIPLALAAVLCAAPALAQDSVFHAGQASGNASAAAGHSVVAGAQFTLGAASLPVALAGGVSVAAGTAGASVSDAAVAGGEAVLDTADQALKETWGPLEVDEAVVIGAPPSGKPGK